jgi:hypothetical protein
MDFPLSGLLYTATRRNEKARVNFSPGPGWAGSVREVEFV